MEEMHVCSLLIRSSARPELDDHKRFSRIHTWFGLRSWISSNASLCVYDPYRESLILLTEFFDRLSKPNEKKSPTKTTRADQDHVITHVSQYKLHAGRRSSTCRENLLFSIFKNNYEKIIFSTFYGSKSKNR